MEWILNDLSLSKNFSDVDDFVVKMSEFLKVKNNNRQLNQHMLCSRSLGNMKVLENVTFSQVVMKRIDPNLRSQILSWLNKKGPFWADDRVINDDDYFEFNAIDVTDQGLGECARRKISGFPVCSYSFEGNYSNSPLIIQHGLAEEPFGFYDIENISGINGLIASVADALPTPKNWREAIDRLIEKYQCLIISKKVYEQMAPIPFSEGNYKSIDERFRVLKEYIESRDQHGDHTAQTEQIVENYFHGEKAWFSNSSDSERRKFKKALSFVDLLDAKKKLFPFHGKIKTPQLRIHFGWPISPNVKKIQVVYIGEKLTKR